MTLKKRRWLLLLIACLVNLAAGSIYTWSVFSPAKATQMSLLGEAVTAGNLSIIFCVANAMCPVTMILGGLFIDRMGPRFVTVFGGVLIAAGLFASGLAESMTSLIVSYGICFGLGIGLVYGAVISNTIKFFPDRRGLVAGLTTASYSICAFFLPPIAHLLIESQGIKATFKILGLALGGVIVLGGLLSEKCPTDFLIASASEARNPEKKSHDLHWREMLVCPIFYCMLGFMTCSSLAGMMIGSQATSIAAGKAHLYGQAAALSVSLFALVNTLGRIFAGFISDKWGRFPTLLTATALSAIGLICLYLCSPDRLVLYYGAMLVLGTSMGGFMGIYPAFTADEFGTKHNSTNYGFMFCGCAVSGLLGSGMVDYLQKISGGYDLPILVATAITLTGFLFAMLYVRFHRRTL